MIRRTYFMSCDIVENGKVTGSSWRVFDRISWFRIPDGVVIESIILEIATERNKSVQDFKVVSFNRL